MSRSYSRDLRVRVIEAISGGLSTRKAAARFGIGVSTAGAWMRRYRETGEIAARKQGQPGDRSWMPMRRSFWGWWRIGPTSEVVPENRTGG